MRHLTCGSQSRDSENESEREFSHGWSFPFGFEIPPEDTSAFVSFLFYVFGRLVEEK